MELNRWLLEILTCKPNRGLSSQNLPRRCNGRHHVYSANSSSVSLSRRELSLVDRSWVPVFTAIWWPGFDMTWWYVTRLVYQQRLELLFSSNTQRLTWRFADIKGVNCVVIFRQRHTVVSVNQQRFKSTQTQHSNSVSSFIDFPAPSCGRSIRSLWRGSLFHSPLFHLYTCVFYPMMVEWNERKM